SRTGRCIPQTEKQLQGSVAPLPRTSLRPFRSRSDLFAPPPRYARGGVSQAVCQFFSRCALVCEQIVWLIARDAGGMPSIFGGSLIPSDIFKKNGQWSGGCQWTRGQRKSVSEE